MRLQRIGWVGLLALGACNVEVNKGDDADCYSFDVTNPRANEKVNAGLCYGLGFYDGNTSCEFLSDIDVTSCDVDGVYWYEVEFYETADGTEGVIYGSEYPDQTGDDFAVVYQRASDGSFRYEDYVSGDEIAYCTVSGGVAEVCIWN